MKTRFFSLLFKSASGVLLLCLLALVSGTLLLQPGNADAAIVYGSDDRSPGLIYTINTANGARSVVGRLAFLTSAIAQHPVTGLIYHVEKTSNGRVATWNPLNNTNTIIGNTGKSATFIKLSFRGDGTLYGMASGDNNIYQINTTNGAATALGVVSGIQGSWGDLSFGSGHVPYLIDDINTKLYTFDITTRVATLVGNVGYSYQAGLVFADGFLYSAYRDLIRINPTTGAGTRVTWFPDSVRITDLTTKIPIIAQITAAKTASPSIIAAGGTVTYTITITNSGQGNGYVTQVRDALPSGFSYVPGSSTGLTTVDPSINGQTLEWSGGWNVDRLGGTVTLTFKAKANSTSGTSYNNVSISGLNFTSYSTGDTAPVTVTAPLLNLAKTVDKATAAPGEELIYSIHYRNLGDGSAHTLIIMDTIPLNAAYVTGSMKIGYASSTYATAATTLTDGSGDDAGEVSGNNVIFTITVVDPNDGTVDSGNDEGKVYFKVTVN